MKKSTTASFLLELPLRVDAGQAARLHAHLEAARQLYNALLGQAMKRLYQMRADPGWQQARSLPRTHTQERSSAFAALRSQYGFSEYGLHAAAKDLRCSWLAEHVDATMAQTLASRAYQAANRVCLGRARGVRFKSKGKGLDSVEGKRNDTGLRFRLQEGAQGNQGWLLWGKDQIPALIDWQDPVVQHGLSQRIKYVRLVRRRASSPLAQRADCRGMQYVVQLILQGRPLQKPKHAPGRGTVGLDLGPSMLAIVPQQGEARLLLLAEELAPDAGTRRRLQRRLDRQRRANNPEHFDERGQVKKRTRGKTRRWQESKGYQKTRRRLATTERKLAAHRRSLHGRLANQIVALGDDIRIEHQSYTAWQRRFGRSVAIRAPGRFVEALKCAVARTGTVLLHELSTHQTRLSQWCHGCRTCTKKPLSQRVHQCPHCGLGTQELIQRDLYSAWLASEVDPLTYRFPCRDHLQAKWSGVETRLRAALQDMQQQASAQGFLRRLGIPRAGACRPERVADPQQEPAASSEESEALLVAQEPL